MDIVGFENNLGSCWCGQVFVLSTFCCAVVITIVCSLTCGLSLSDVLFVFFFACCCECMRWDVDIHSRVLRSEKGCRIRVTHVHACSDCVHTRDDTVRLDYASRFVRVVGSSHIVSIKLGTVTPLRRCGLALHERKDGPASMGLSALVQESLPGGAARTRLDDTVLAVPPALALTQQPACFQCCPHVSWRDLPSSLKQCCPLPRGSRSGGATRTRLAVPPARANLFHAALAVLPARAPDDASHASNVASPASVSLQFQHCFPQVL